MDYDPGLDYMTRWLSLHVAPGRTIRMKFYSRRAYLSALLLDGARWPG